MVETGLLEAVKQAVADSKPRKFSESVELAINLKDIDLSNPKNRLQEEVILPHGRGRTIRVAVFGSGELAVKAKDVADLVIQPQEIEDYAGDKKKMRKLAAQFDYALAEAPLMPTIGKRLGVVLGPRGKMPKPIPPGADPAPIIANLRNTVSVRSKDRRTFHAPIGTKEMPIEDLAENADLLLKRIIGKLERGRQNIESAYVKTTMGPAKRVI